LLVSVPPSAGPHAGEVDGPGEVRVVWDDGRVGSTPAVRNRCRVLSAAPAATALIFLSGCGNGDGAEYNLG